MLNAPAAFQCQDRLGLAVDLGEGQAPPAVAEPPVPGNHDLAATVHALAAQSRSFGGSAQPRQENIDLDGIDPAMITRYITCLVMCPQDPHAPPYGCLLCAWEDCTSRTMMRCSVQTLS